MGRELAGLRALVTGASSGIGAAMARLLAARGCDVVLAARRRERLEALAVELRATGVAAQVVVADLGVRGGAAALYQAAGPLDILVNNAGFGYYRGFGAVSLEHDLSMLELNVMSLVELSYWFVADARARGRRAYVLNVASIGAYQSVPFMASYTASKAYVRNFSEALWHETRGSNVSVTCLSPGGTRTEFLDIAGQRVVGKVAAASMMDAEPVARIGLEAMLAGRRTVIPGLMNKLSCFFVRLIPRRMASWAAMRVLGKPPATAVPGQRGAPPALPPSPARDA
jgi:short-subunit dehydrogenase